MEAGNTVCVGQGSGPESPPPVQPPHLPVLLQGRERVLHAGLTLAAVREGLLVQSILTVSRSSPEALVPNYNVAGLFPRHPGHPTPPSVSLPPVITSSTSTSTGWVTLGDPPTLTRTFSSISSSCPPPSSSSSSLDPAPPVGSVHLAWEGVGGALPCSPQPQEKARGQLCHGAN